MRSATANDILTYCKENQRQMIELLKDLVQIETPSTDPAAQQPIFRLLREEFEKLNFDVFERTGRETGGFIYARPKPRNKSKRLQLLVGHCDTVWDKNTLLKMPITNMNGTLTGPGVYDMKAGLTQMIFALRGIRTLELSMPLSPIVLINSDEEIGSIESGCIIQKLAKLSDRAYVLEPPLGLDGKLKTARKGIGRFTLRVEGKAAHAGLDPTKGVNAIVELSHLVQELYAMNDYDKGITVNVGTIQGGISPNVVAPMSQAVIDVRVETMEDGEYITNKIYGLNSHNEDVSVQIKGGIGRPPMERTVRNQSLWNLAKTSADELGIHLEQAMAGGGSDGNTTSLYTATLDGLGTTGDGAHALHEHILIDHLPERTALLAMLLMAN